MKKWILLASSLLAMNAEANQAFCGYKDYFRLSDQSHPAIYIVRGWTDSDLYMEIVGPRSFVIRDAAQCRTGYAHVTVSYDSATWCVLDIKDGPYKRNPRIYASCNGMRFVKLEHDSIGSHSYTIHLD